MFWVFKLGDQWARLPKPFSLGYIFGSVPERFLTWADLQKACLMAKILRMS